MTVISSLLGPPRASTLFSRGPGAADIAGEMGPWGADLLGLGSVLRAPGVPALTPRVWAGFIFCEIQKWKDTQNASQNKVKIVGLGLLRVLQNPIVFMVFIGIAFNFILDQKITSGMVISTFVSAPIMYVSAWLLTFPTMDPKPLEYAIQNVSFDISIISLVSLIWSLAILLLSKKYKQLPHMLTTNLLIAQSIVCAGMMIWNFVKEKNFVGQILVFVLLYSSLYSTYLWTGLLAISLFLLKKRERVQIPVGIIIISGWGIPALLVGVLLITGKHNGESIDSAFFYGKEQMIITAVTLFCSIVIAGVSLMCMNRTSQAGRYEGFDQSQDHKAAEPGNTAFEESPEPINEPEPFTSSIPETSCCSCSMGNGELRCTSTEPVANISTSRPVTPSFEKKSFQLFMVAIQPRAWKTGFISFGIFGLDKHLIILPFKRRLEFLWNNKETAENKDSPVPEEIKMTCQQFIHYHRDLCIQNIVKERRCGARTSAGTFCGCDLVNWLIEVGLASDRGEAVIYGDRLVQGGVIQHITNEYEFRDEYLFYRFLHKSPEQSPPAINAHIPQQERYKETEHSSPSHKT
ncbi:integral membrane protein GPR155 [Camelus ferus]|nr:integral membrane protein GPR155 [Camelus ferus]